MSAPGPFRADQLKPKDPYELSNGHSVFCLPTGARGGRANLVGGAVLDSDPAVKSAGRDVGFSPDPGMLRAPDISVGDVPNAPGWVRGVPPLAVEYADTGQEEEKLQEKIADLLAAGTKLVWVVRLVGPQRVEVYERGVAVRTVAAGGTLTAPGILQNPVPVVALYDREAAHEATLRNLLQRKGYSSLEDVAKEGREEGRALGVRASILQVLAHRALHVSPEERARIDACVDLPTLERWLTQALASNSAAEALR